MSLGMIVSASANERAPSAHAKAVDLTWKSARHDSEMDGLLAFSLPFADFHYLRNCVWTRYAGRLKMLSEHLPVAAAVAEALTGASDNCKHRVIGDPIVRTAIDRSLYHFRLGSISRQQEQLEQFEQILNIAIEQLKNNQDRSVLNLGAQELRSGPEEYSAWIWSNERKDDVQTQVFQSLYYGMEGKRSVPVTPTCQELETLRQSLELLRLVIPQTARSAMDHVHLIVISDAAPDAPEKKLPFTSFTALTIPSTIFLNRSVLSSCWKAAESILHEALHEKLYDFQHTHSLVRSGYTVKTSPKICSEWNRPAGEGSNCWPVCRSTFAFHVYVYLSEFFLRLEGRFPELERRFGPRKDFDPAVSARRSLDRAHHLSFHISALEQELGAAGRALVQWLTGYLQAADPNPPLPGSYLHLLLDLYEREGKQLIESNAGNVSKEREEQLQRMIRSETFLTRQITSALDIATEAQPSVESARGNLAEQIKAARQWIHASLRKIPAEKASAPILIGSETKLVGEAIRGLVLTSGNEIA